MYPESPALSAASRSEPPIPTEPANVDVALPVATKFAAVTVPPAFTVPTVSVPEILAVSASMFSNSASPSSSTLQFSDAMMTS